MKHNNTYPIIAAISLILYSILSFIEEIAEKSIHARLLISGVSFCSFIFSVQKSRLYLYSPFSGSWKQLFASRKTESSSSSFFTLSMIIMITPDYLRYLRTVDRSYHIRFSMHVLCA